MKIILIDTGIVRIDVLHFRFFKMNHAHFILYIVMHLLVELKEFFLLLDL